MERCGTREFTKNDWENPSTRTKVVHLLWKRHPQYEKQMKPESSPSCETRSEALKTSRETRLVPPYLPRAADQEYGVIASRSSVDHWVQNSCWRSLSERSCSRNGRSWSAIAILKTFEITEIKVIGMVVVGVRRIPHFLGRKRWLHSSME